MIVDRASIVEAEHEIETGLWDLVLMEDLSKAYRNPRISTPLCRTGVDAETRVICTGDNLDTAILNGKSRWDRAALRRGLHIPDTRRRVRRTATYEFQKLVESGTSRLKNVLRECFRQLPGRARVFRFFSKSKIFDAAYEHRLQRPLSRTSVTSRRRSASSPERA